VSDPVVDQLREQITTADRSLVETINKRLARRPGGVDAARETMERGTLPSMRKRTRGDSLAPKPSEQSCVPTALAREADNRFAVVTMSGERRCLAPFRYSNR